MIAIIALCVLAFFLKEHTRVNKKKWDWLELQKIKCAHMSTNIAKKNIKP